MLMKSKSYEQEDLDSSQAVKQKKEARGAR